jgi:hypothetical protein
MKGEIGQAPAKNEHCTKEEIDRGNHRDEAKKALARQGWIRP